MAVSIDKGNFKNLILVYLLLLSIGFVFLLPHFRTTLHCTRQDPQNKFCTVTSCRLFNKDTESFYFSDLESIEYKERSRAPDGVLLVTKAGNFEVGESSSPSKLHALNGTIYNYFYIDVEQGELFISNFRRVGVIGTFTGSLLIGIAIFLGLRDFVFWYPRTFPAGIYFEKLREKIAADIQRQIEAGHARFRRKAELRIDTRLSPDEVKRRLERRVENPYISLPGKLKEKISKAIQGEVYEWTHDGYRFVLHRKILWGRYAFGNVQGDIERLTPGSLIWAKYSRLDYVSYLLASIFIFGFIFRLATIFNNLWLALGSSVVFVSLHMSAIIQMKKDKNLLFGLLQDLFDRSTNI